MLVLSRKVGESILAEVKVTPDATPIQVWITIVEIERGKIRLGLDGDRDKVIFAREEILPKEKRK
jgi:sRNA-binding carbon storage regulator CsrA